MGGREEKGREDDIHGMASKRKYSSSSEKRKKKKNKMKKNT